MAPDRRGRRFVEKEKEGQTMTPNIISFIIMIAGIVAVGLYVIHTLTTRKR